MELNIPGSTLLLIYVLDYAPFVLLIVTILSSIKDLTAKRLSRMTIILAVITGMLFALVALSKSFF